MRLLAVVSFHPIVVGSCHSTELPLQFLEATAIPYHMNAPLLREGAHGLSPDFLGVHRMDRFVGNIGIFIVEHNFKIVTRGVMFYHDKAGIPFVICPDNDIQNFIRGTKERKIFQSVKMVIFPFSCHDDPRLITFRGISCSCGINPDDNPPEFFRGFGELYARSV